MLTKSIESAQKKVEGKNFGIRKHVLEYDDVMNKQREIIYKERRRVLAGENLQEQIQDMIHSIIVDAVDEFDLESGFKSEVKGVIADTPSKLRGDRVNYLFFEEAGSDPILVKKYLQNKALVELGGKKIGIRVV